MAAIRTLIAATILARAATDRTAAIARSTWRQTHQAMAKLSHYRRRSDPTHHLLL